MFFVIEKVNNFASSAGLVGKLITTAVSPAEPTLKVIPLRHEEVMVIDECMNWLWWHKISVYESDREFGRKDN